MYIFYEVDNLYDSCWIHNSNPIPMNLYEWPTPNTTPKPIHLWGLNKSYKIVRVRSYEFVRISHLIKYVLIGHEIVLAQIKHRLLKTV